MKRGNWDFCKRVSTATVWVLACILICASQSASATVAAIQWVDAAIRLEDGSEYLACVRLPYRWDKRHRGISGSATFRFVVPVDQSERPWALYLPRVGNQVEIWADGRLMLGLGKLGVSNYDAAKAPRLVELGQLSHQVDVVIKTTSQPSRWGGLTVVYAGPEAELLPQYQRRYYLRQYGALVVSSTMILIAFMSLGVWWMRREPAFGVFAVAELAGALRFSDRLIHEPPLPWPWWGAVNAAALILYVVLIAWFSMLLGDVRRRWLERLLLASLLGSLLLVAVSFSRHYSWAWDVALGALAIPSFTVLALVSFKAWQERTRATIGIAIAGLVVNAAGFRDFFFVRRPEDGSEAFSILPHASLLFVLLVGWVVVDRYARHAREHQELAQMLESKVRERELELELTNQKLREEHARKATLLERQRIMRDIHDGVGAQLVGLLNLIHRDSASKDVLEDQARGALDELRMAVDALQPVHDDLATVLATLRFRLQPRLEEAGIQVDWGVDELPPMPGLTPNMVLQIQRILLEAFTNVMRHAEASRLEVRAQFSAQPEAAFLLSVRDNGIGLTPDGVPSRGQGLRNMAARAEAIGASLEVKPDPLGGTAVALTLPLPA